MGQTGEGGEGDLERYILGMTIGRWVGHAVADREDRAIGAGMRGMGRGLQERQGQGSKLEFSKYSLGLW